MEAGPWPFGSAFGDMGMAHGANPMANTGTARAVMARGSMHQRHTHPMLENRRGTQSVIRRRANLCAIRRMDRD